MQVWNVLHAARWNTGRKKSPFWHHRTTLSGYIFWIKASIDNRKKNLLNSNTSSTCPDNIVNFGLLTAETRWRVWGTPANRLGSVTAWHSSRGRQNFATLNRGRHLYSTGQPSRWALAHILVVFSFFITLFCMVPCGRLSWLFVSFWAHVNSVSYRIVTGRKLRST